MSKTRRSARNLTVKSSMDSEVEEPLHQEPQPPTTAEDVPRNKRPTIKIKFMLPQAVQVQSKKDEQSEGHGQSTSPESVGEQVHHPVSPANSTPLSSPSPAGEPDAWDAVLETEKEKGKHKKSATAATKRPKKSQPKAKAGRQPRTKSIRKATDPVADISEEEAEPVDEVVQKFHVLVPNKLRAQRRTLTIKTTYNAALEIIHEAAECVSVKRKPNLSYKLNCSGKQPPQISLASAEDWDGLIGDAIAAGVKLKGTAIVSFTIFIPEQYLASLAARSSKSKTTTGKGKKAKPILLDLDADDSSNADDEDKDDGGIAGREIESMTKLEKSLTQCQLCGPDKFCMVAKSGEHVSLTHGQRRAWACSLAAGTHGVTLKVPPKSEMFAQFCSSVFPKASNTSCAESSAPAPTIGVDQTFMLVQMQQMQMSMMQERMRNSNQGPHTPQKRCRAVDDDGSMPSSDPPEATPSQYSSVADFLAKLQLCHPKRNLERYAVTFDESDYYAVDDLKDLSEQQLMDRFAMSSGNASFLLREVKNEMKRADRSTKHRRYK